ncbi:Peptidase, M23/M37 family [hydrothermal vent metagenome]|uniref:Peptidase, M23/M37 family n=1 Tax=hydrothermal vent metagenome TaxID=652676 RepID=A0A1W1EK29_9ZZZZ
MNRNRSIFRKKKSNGIGKFIFFLIVIGGVAGFIYTSNKFERIKPNIIIHNSGYWSKKIDIKIDISDNYLIDNYQVIVEDGENKFELAKEKFIDDINSKTIYIKYPSKLPIRKDVKELKITIIVKDKSLWNMGMGNKESKSIILKIDHIKPKVKIISNSYSIRKGGSALVIFEATDDAIDTIYIDTKKHKFRAEPYYKKGYYASLIAWEFNQDKFVATIVVKDKAGNIRERKVPIYLKDKKYKVSYIQATDKFIDGKISDLIVTDSKYDDITDRLEKLKAINEDMRISNEKLIHKLSSGLSQKLFRRWKIKRFHPLNRAAVVATFGDERHYYYENKDNEISQSYHVGLDLASTAMAPIISSNAGLVVFADENGIYGNMPMIDHGMGLFTIYGHCSSILVSKGDIIKAGTKIAQTGKSGLALGDHLHFGILVQGVEVRIAEWMDSNWIKTNIDNIFKEARDRIGK